MTETGETTTGVQQDDIIFECPHCGKSLAIDGRAAGMVIVCPDCQARVQVPGGEDDARIAEQAAALDRLRADNIDHIAEIGKELELMQAALDRIVGILLDVSAEIESA